MAASPGTHQVEVNAKEKLSIQMNWSSPPVPSALTRPAAGKRGQPIDDSSSYCRTGVDDGSVMGERNWRTR